jgi:hypothetical protein
MCESSQKLPLYNFLNACSTSGAPGYQQNTERPEDRSSFEKVRKISGESNWRCAQI